MLDLLLGVGTPGVSAKRGPTAPPSEASRSVQPMSLTPLEFAAKWQGGMRTERAASQEHFIDLCRMVGTKTPNEADPNLRVRKGRRENERRRGVCRRLEQGYFAWEYKGKRKDLAAAYASCSSTGRR